MALPLRRRTGRRRNRRPAGPVRGAQGVGGAGIRAEGRVPDDPLAAFRPRGASRRGGEGPTPAVPGGRRASSGVRRRLDRRTLPEQPDGPRGLPVRLPPRSRPGSGRGGAPGPPVCRVGRGRTPLRPPPRNAQGHGGHQRGAPRRPPAGSHRRDARAAGVRLRRPQLLVLGPGPRAVRQRHRSHLAAPGTERRGTAGAPRGASVRAFPRPRRLPPPGRAGRRGPPPLRRAPAVHAGREHPAPRTRRDRQDRVRQDAGRRGGRPPLFHRRAGGRRRNPGQPSGRRPAQRSPPGRPPALDRRRRRPPLRRTRRGLRRRREGLPRIAASAAGRQPHADDLHREPDRRPRRGGPPPLHADRAFHRALARPPDGHEPPDPGRREPAESRRRRCARGAPLRRTRSRARSAGAGHPGHRPHRRRRRRTLPPCRAHRARDLPQPGPPAARPAGRGETPLERLRPPRQARPGCARLAGGRGLRRRGQRRSRRRPGGAPEGRQPALLRASRHRQDGVRADALRRGRRAALLRR